MIFRFIFLFPALAIAPIICLANEPLIDFSYSWLDPLVKGICRSGEGLDGCGTTIGLGFVFTSSIPMSLTFATDLQIQRIKMAQADALQYVASDCFYNTANLSGAIEVFQDLVPGITYEDAAIQIALL